MYPAIGEDGCCASCGKLRVVGDWPGCPHGSPISDPFLSQFHQDSIPGGLLLENYGPTPVRVYSHTERKQLMLQRGLELRERFSPMPGTDIDPQGIPNPKGYVDAYTLEAGAALILRAQGQPAVEEGPVVHPHSPSDEEFTRNIRVFKKLFKSQERRHRAK